MTKLYIVFVMIRFPRSTPLRLSNSGYIYSRNARPAAGVSPGQASEAIEDERGLPRRRHPRTFGRAHHRLRGGGGLTRRSGKEVIQPQVPLRLPCYDFAPVTELTFGGCLLAVSPPTSGPPSFHGVTGGVYKARERIHRGVADPRLLAIPASCSRVADYNPNLDRLLAISAPSRVGDALYRPL